MLKRTRLNTFLFIALSISISINFYNGFKRAKESSVKVEDSRIIFEVKQITHLILKPNAAELITKNGRKLFHFDEGLHAEVMNEAKKRHIATTHQKYSKPPIWIDAIINWGPVSIVILIFLLGVNLSRKFNT